MSEAEKICDFVRTSVRGSNTPSFTIDGDGVPVDREGTVYEITVQPRGESDCTALALTETRAAFARYPDYRASLDRILSLVDRAFPHVDEQASALLLRIKREAAGGGA